MQSAFLVIWKQQRKWEKDGSKGVTKQAIMLPHPMTGDNGVKPLTGRITAIQDVDDLFPIVPAVYLVEFVIADKFSKSDVEVIGVVDVIDTNPLGGK